jgi:methyl-accepting chemotaxis protein
VSWSPRRSDAHAAESARLRRGSSLRTRLIGAFAAVSSLTLGASLVAFVSYNRIQSGFERIERVGIPAMSRALTLARQASDFSGTTAAFPNANNQSELQAGVARSRKALEAMSGSLAEIAASTGGGGVAERLKADFRGLGVDADDLAKSVETRIGLAKRRLQMVAEAEAAHRELAATIVPLVDSSEFDLQLGLQSAMDDKAAQQLQEGASSVQALHQLMAESNLIVGLLVEASLADQVELLTPFRDRLTASEGKAEKAAAALSKNSDAGGARAALQALIAFGQEDKDIFHLRRRELEELAAERKIIADTRDKSIALAAHVEELVAGARDVSQAAIATSQQSIELSRYWLVGLTLCGLVLASVIGWLQVGRGVLSALGALHKAFAQLADGNLDANIPPKIVAQRDEFGDMARALQVFKDNAVERVGVEREARAAREAAESERGRSAAERASSVAEQGDVVRRLGDALRRLAAGDLTERLSEGFTRDYAQIRNDFNDALDILSETLRGVIAGVDAIQSGGDRILAGAHELSLRTTQQASRLEETVNALDLITSTVKKSAAGALHARDIVRTADTDAQSSARVMSDTVAAMGSISSSSQQVAQIIGVIDEIAFQTNLLALNAGVEAARAGDTGRGFAVVAAEVRALAQRSAVAAKEIKQLISDSGAQIERGVALVAKTGESLGRITGQMAEVTSVVGAIAQGAAEQAASMNEANAAIAEMDIATQQNAAMAEESTAAINALAEESRTLARLVEQFRVGARKNQRRDITEAA